MICFISCRPIFWVLAHPEILNYDKDRDDLLIYALLYQVHLGHSHCIPGHILRPAPNGISSKCWPSKSMLLFINLSGKNSSRFFVKYRTLPIGTITIPETMSTGPALIFRGPKSNSIFRALHT